MATENPSNDNQQFDSADAFNIKDLFYLCLSKWYWFVISLVVCVGYTYWNLLKTPDVYTRMARVQIKEYGNNPYYSGEFNMNLFNGYSNINDEIAHFRSPDVITEVVKRLHLDMNYSTEGRFHDNVLYGPNLPLTATIEGIGDNDYVGFTITELADGTLSLSDFSREGLPEDSVNMVIPAAFKKAVQTPVGKVTVIQSDTYTPAERKIKVKRNGLKGTTSAYTDKLNIAVDPDAFSIVNISATDVSAARAEDFINMVLNVYNQKWMDDKNQIAISTYNFINSRLEAIEEELRDVDTDISSYKSSNLITDVQATSDMYLQQASAASSAILQLNNQLNMARYVRDYLTNETSKFQLLPVNTGFENAGIATEIAAYNKTMLQRQTIVANSSEQNPIVEDLDANLANMRRSIISSIDNAIISLNAQIKTQRQSEGHAVSQIASNPKQARYLLDVERRQKVKESLYLFLLQKREENELSKAFTAYNTRLVASPTGSSSPTGPNRNRALLIAFVVGIALPLIIIFLFDFLNTKVRGRLDLEKLSAPFLGEIPLAPGLKRGNWLTRLFMKKEKKETREIVIRRGNRNMINEAFRVLRTNLDLIMSKSPTHNVVSITSFNPGSGKSFITMNLAVAIAIRNKRVLVIDGDLRHGSLSTYVNSPSVGLTDYLRGRTNNLSELLVQMDDYPTLDVLPVGQIPPNPTELLEDPRMQQLLETVRSQYTYVFIDCPPIDIVADTQIIERQSDRTIFVVRAGLLERAMVTDIEEMYRTKRLKNISLVLNGIESSDGKYGYKYSYKYGYYGHGGSSYYSHEE